LRHRGPSDAGAERTQGAARTNRERLDVPVIFITIYDEPGARERALQAGAVSYLRKPFSEDALPEAIRAVSSELSGRRRP
jgi:CheY-like chemotaxis protein